MMSQNESKELNKQMKNGSSFSAVDALLLLFSTIFGMTTVWFLLKRLQDLRVPTIAILVVALIAIGLFASLWLPKRVRPQIVMLTCSIMFALYLAEAFMSWVGNPLDYETGRWLAALVGGERIEPDMPQDVYIYSIDEGKNVTMALPPADLLNNRTLPNGDDGNVIFPLSNEAGKTAVYCNELGYHVTYETDKYGFHNPRGIWDQDIQLAIIGDSYANGACVESDDNALAHIRKQYPGTVTVGASGNGPLLELASFREYIEPHQPDVVMWWYFEGNDIFDLQTEKRDWFIPQYVESTTFTQNLIARQSEIDRVRNEYIGVLEVERRAEIPDATDYISKDTFTMRRFLTLFQLRRLLRIDFLPPDQIDDLNKEKTPVEPGIEGEIEGEADRVHIVRMKPRLQNDADIPVIIEGEDGVKRTADGEEITPSLQNYLDAIAQLEENLTIFKRSLVATRDAVHGWGGEFIIVYIPQWERYELETRDGLFLREDVLPVLEELEVPIIDVKLIQDEHEDPLSLYPFRIDGHYNSEGYQFLADIILENLESVIEP